MKKIVQPRVEAHTSGYIFTQQTHNVWNRKACRLNLKTWKKNGSLDCSKLSVSFCFHFSSIESDSHCIIMIKLDGFFRMIHKYIGLAMSLKNIVLACGSHNIFKTHSSTNIFVYHARSECILPVKLDPPLTTVFKEEEKSITIRFSISLARLTMECSSAKTYLFLTVRFGIHVIIILDLKEY